MLCNRVVLYFRWAEGEEISRAEILDVTVTWLAKAISFCVYIYITVI